MLGELANALGIRWNDYTKEPRYQYSAKDYPLHPQCLNCLEAIKKYNEKLSDDDKCVPVCFNGFDRFSDVKECLVLTETIDELTPDGFEEKVRSRLGLKPIDE